MCSLERTSTGESGSVSFLEGLTLYRSWFKKVVYQTNHSRVEKLLLLHESLRQSFRLILMDAFADDEPEITSMVKLQYRKCPKLFDTLLTRSEQQSLHSKEALDEEEDDYEELALQSDDAHRHTTVTGCLASHYIKNNLKLPVRSTDPLMTPHFRAMLRRAFETDYGMANVFHFGTTRMRWCKKVSFISG